MKVVLSGATGYIGKAVLQECLRRPEITSLVILSRKLIPQVAENPKVKVILLGDFNQYPEDTLSDLRDADAALWCVGTSTGSQAVDIDYPLAFCHALLSDSGFHKQRKALGRPFKFILLGGAFTEPDQGKTLWFIPYARKLNGRAHTEVLALNDHHQNTAHDFGTFVVRPGGVLWPQHDGGLAGWSSWLADCIFGEKFAIQSHQLGGAMAEIAINGVSSESVRIVENLELRKIGDRCLQN